MDNLTGDLAWKAAKYYRLFTRDRDDIRFFIKLATTYGGPVLEVGCGTGRVASRIAACGIPTDGLDLSDEKLSLAYEARADLDLDSRLRLNFFRAKMQSFTLARRYQIAIFPFHGLQELITADEKVECLRCVHRHLADSGLVLIDNFNPSVHILASEPGASAQVAEQHGEDGEVIRRTDRVVSLDYGTQTLHLEVIYDVTHRDGQSEHMVMPYQTSYLFRYELEHLLARCGFEVMQTWGGYDFEPFGTQYPGKLIVLARRIDDLIDR